MRKFNTQLLPLFFLTLWIFCGCGNNTGNRREAETATEVAVGGQKVSPTQITQAKIGNADVKVQYGSPAVRNRTIWGDLVPYGEVWRTGANEATFVEFSKDVNVEGKPLKAGKYSLFTIPREKEDWVVIFNAEWNLQHGHYQYKEENDVLRVEVTPQWVQHSEENLSINVEDQTLVIRWEKLRLPIRIN